MTNPFMGNSRSPRGIGSVPGGGMGAAGGRRSQGSDQQGSSPLQPLISPQQNVPFASFTLPNPDAAITEQVGYFGVQYVGGRESGTLNFTGYNLRAWSTLNTGGFPGGPSWGPGFQTDVIGTNTGAGAGIIIAHTDSLGGMRPVLNTWVGGPSLFPWLTPGTANPTYTGGTDRQLIGHPFAMGDLVASPQSYEITPRDTPLGWDVNLSQGVWVLIAIDAAALNLQTDPADMIFALTNGRLIFADEERRNPQGG